MAFLSINSSIPCADVDYACMCRRLARTAGHQRRDEAGRKAAGQQRIGPL